MESEANMLSCLESGVERENRKMSRKRKGGQPEESQKVESRERVQGSRKR